MARLEMGNARDHISATWGFLVIQTLPPDCEIAENTRSSPKRTQAHDIYKLKVINGMLFICHSFAYESPFFNCSKSIRPIIDHCGVKIDDLLGQLCGRWGSSASLPIQFKRRCVDAFATSTYLKPQCFNGMERRERED